jgi:acylpyruvate hydrolase
MTSFQLSRFREFGKKIVGAARTYREHAVELNNPVPTEPFIFLKPTTSYITEGQKILLPRGAKEIHHEVELGVVIGSTGRCIPESRALEHVGGYTLALDMTDREAQGRAKKAGLPWTLAKGFDTACPVSRFIEKSEIQDPQNVELWLNVNGVNRQRCSTSEMIFTIPYLISWISGYMTLEPGDLILTGTPAGVGPVKAGDRIECGLANLVNMTFDVEGRE